MVRTRHGARQTRRGVVLLVTVVVVAGAIGGLRWWIAQTRPKLDAETLCPPGGPLGLTVVVIDRTEAMSALQTEALRHRLDRLKEALPPMHAIEVYSIVPMGGSVLRPSGSRVCSPPLPSSGLTANPARAKKVWTSRFSEPLEQTFATLLEPHDEPTSPILESLQSISVTAFDTIDASLPRRLVVVSDMLQNTPEFSQYSDRRTFTELRSSAYYGRVRAALPRVQVQIVYVRRHQLGAIQGAAHVRFWEEYFSDCGATLESVVSLNG